MGRNVKDCALLQEIISSYDPNDSTSIDFKRNNYSELLTNNIKGKKNRNTERIQSRRNAKRN